jgi:hypothetical protein
MLRIAALLLLLTASTALAAEPPLAADVTERGRSLATALDRLLAPAKEARDANRTVWLLLDPTDSLRRAAFADAVRDALIRNTMKLEKTRIGVVTVGAEAKPLLPPTKDQVAIYRAVSEATARPVRTFQNLYASVRRLAAAPADGRREIVLVSLENGDAEDELAGTVAALRRGKARLSAIAREAFLSDSFWVRRASTAPRGMKMAGGEAAFIQVPWGWIFQQGELNEYVPSGFAMFGITRMAAATGGRVFLYYPPTTTTPTCAIQGHCPFCPNDQVNAHEFYENHRLRALSPLAGSRSQVSAALAKDAYLRAALKAWAKAEKGGILWSRPSVRVAGSSLRPERRQLGNGSSLGRSVSFSSQASKAEKLLPVIDRIIAELAADIEKAESGSARCRATAELTLLLLRVTRVNVLGFVAFCREVGPVQVAQLNEELVPPERARWEGSYTFTGIMATNMTLSHGVRPFLELRLPGGDEMQAAIEGLAGPFEKFMRKYGRTPFGEAARQAGIAKFQLTVRGKAAPPPERQPRSSETDDTTTQKERPSRGGGGSGGGGGPTSGGK